MTSTCCQWSASHFSCLWFFSLDPAVPRQQGVHVHKQNNGSHWRVSDLMTLVSWWVDLGQVLTCDADAIGAPTPHRRAAGVQAHHPFVIVAFSP